MLVERYAWEKKSLDMDICNIYLDENDECEETINAINSLNNQALVIYVPVDNTLIQDKLEKEGFSLVDQMTVFESKLDEVPRTSIQQRLYDVVSVQRMDAEDLVLLKDEVNNGFFGLDWISKEKGLDIDVSAQRYNALIDNLWKNGTLFYKHMYKDVAIGFFTLSELGKGVYHFSINYLLMHYIFGLKHQYPNLFLC